MVKHMLNINDNRRKIKYSTTLIRNLIRQKLAIETKYRILPKPTVLVVECINSCNSKCIYCDIWKEDHSKDEILTESEIKKIISEARKLGIFSVALTGGGEPLLRKDLSNIISHCKKNDLHILIATNGTLIGEENVDMLLELDCLLISIDSVDEKKHNFRRGIKEGFTKTMAGIELVVRKNENKNTYLITQSVVDEANWHEVPEINEYFYSKGVDTAFILLYNHFFTIPEKEWQDMIKKIRYHSRITKILMSRFLRYFPKLASGEFIPPCYAGDYCFVVTATADLLPCCRIRKPICNLRDTSLSVAWNALEMQCRNEINSRDRKCVCGDTLMMPISLLLAGNSYNWSPRALI